MMGKDTAIASLKEKIDGLNQLAWEVRVNDSPKAFEVSEESVKLARSINYTKGLAEGLRSLGFAYVRLFKNEEAAPLLREALSLFQSLNDIKGQAITYEYLGIIERNWGNLGTSLELLLKGDALIQQVGSVEIEVTSSYQIGVTYKHLGNHENALDYLYKALSIAKSSGNLLMEAYATNIIGSIYFDNGDYNHALDCYQRGLVIRRESNDKWGEAGSLDNIGFTYLKLEDLDKAIDYCKQSLAISQSTGDKKGEANALLHLAEIYEQAGDIKQASKFSNKSFEIRKVRGDRRGETEVLLFLADLHKNSNDRESNQIFEWLSGALKIAEEIKAQDLLSKAYYNLHEYYTQNGNFKESLMNLEAHLQIEKELHKNTINQKISNLEISHKAEAISQRNKELTELNEKIEKANAELKIEASLERVRAVAMSMKKPDDLLGICKILFTELEVLGIEELRNAMINIYNDEKNTFLNYDFSGSLGQSITVFSMIHSHPVPDYITKQIRQGKSHFAEIALTGDQLADWIEFREKNGELPDPKLKNARSLCYYFYSVGPAAIGISTLNSITKPDHEVLMRFRNVFDLAYKRYTDINQAEAQAKEAKIEAALERVRATSMAMHHSDDLITVINVVQEQLLGLGFHFHGANFVTDYSENGYTMWLASPGESFPYKIYVPQVGLKYFEAVNAAIEKGSDFATYTLNFEEKNIYFKNLFENSLIKNTSEEGKRIVFESKGMAASVVLLDKVRLNIMNLDLVPFTDEENNILKRFGYVFEQSYTRFLDLQKAEAQAREAQIEAAVEKVRSRSLAMHKSDELQEVVHTVFERLKELDVDFYTAIIILFTEGSKDIVWWLESKANQQYPKMLVPFTPIAYFKELFEIRERGGDLLSKCYSFSEKDELFHHLFENTDFEYVPETQKQFLLGAEFATISVGLAKNTGIHITSYSKRSFSDQDNQIIKRFAKVFDQAYTRFLDLQKAEAQAKEAQIEVALERIRARAMAMHSSNELMDVAHILREQMGLLDQPDLETSVVNLFDEDSDHIHSWHAFREPGSSSGKTINGTVSFRKDSSELTKEMIGLYTSGKKEYTLEATGEKLNEFLQVLINSAPEISNYIGKNPPEKVYYHFATFTGGALLTVSYQPTTEDIKSLQRRAASVFDMAYRRYRDLKKAEAQTREAQIETGLERVRSKTMAMHKSEEVTGVAVSLNEELLRLGFEGGSTIIIINRETGDTEQWTGFSEDKSIKSCFVPFFKHPYHAALLDSWKKGENFLVYTIAGDEKRFLDEHYFTTGYKIFPESDKKWMREMGSVTFSHAFMKYGAIHWGPDHLVEEQLRILQRFSKVFEQSYTRFLDLQKAEVQAREAQIELALERVRARTMAMQKSEELGEVSQVMNEQLRLLNLKNYLAGFLIDYRNSNDLEVWRSDPSGLLLTKIRIPYFDHPVFNSFVESKEKGLDFNTIRLTFEDKNKWVDHALQFSPTASSEMKEFVYNGAGYAASLAYMKNVALFMENFEGIPFSNEENAILKRFGKVFEQTYTRFLDLQKAEAQARDAQIEVALERVRAKVMAMTSSKDLNETSLVFGEQLRKLGIDWQFSYFWLIEEAKNENTFWITWPDNKTSFTTYTLAEAEEYFNDCLISWRAGVKIHDNYVPPEGVQLWLDTFQRIADDAGGEAKKIMVPQTFSNGVFYYDAMMKYGSFGICISKPATEEEKNIQCRFAIEFERAYTRFLDLKQAEAQAREAQIELGLERVRARAMAMQNSGELNDLVAILFEELTRLDLILARCIIWIFDVDTLSARLWMANSEDKKAADSYYIKRLQHSYYESIIKGWKERNPKWVYDLKGDEKETIDKLLLNETELSRLPDAVKNGILNSAHTIVSGSFNNFGLLEASGPFELSEEQIDIVSRFAKVFDLTYTRFNDLKQAEAQAREAKIEAALERVRSRAMAMHKSDDLKMAVATVFEELDKLNIGILRCGIAIMDKEKPRADVWITVKSEQTNTIQLSGDESLDYHPLLRGAYHGWVKQEDFSYVLQGEDLLSYYRDVASIKYQLPVSTPFDKEKIDQQQYYFNAVFQDGSLFAFMETPFTDEAKTVMKRFANVFNLTYKRFLDLQKAEAQAREAQIELGLERVRARAMAMQKSDELKELIATVSTELSKLDIILDRCFIITYDIKTLGATWWMANPETSSDPIGLYVKYHEQAPYLAFLKAWQDRIIKWQYILEGAVKKTWDEFLFVETELSRLPRFVIDNMRANEKVYLSASFNNFGCLTLATLEPLSDEQFDIMLRFAKVFDLTYTRFNDLKQAEAQAREARIETALEKVRASTMAMQRSEDLSQTAFVLFKQFKELGEAPERIFIATFDDHDSGVVDLWGTDQGGNQLNKLFKLPVNEPTMVSKIIAAWKDKKRSVVVDLKGEELKTYLGFLKQAGIPVTEGIMTDRRVQTAACFSNGVIGVTTSEPQSAEAVQLQERFAGVFDLTYTRFLDLQKAEAQAREAKIETALERVRARALAMQEPEELKEVAQVLRTEMGLLGVEELETCSIYINDESAEKAECWYALKDIRSEEKKLVNDHFTLNLNDTWVGREMLQFYQSPQKQISIVMQGENRKEWIRYCEKHSTPLGGYYGEVIPDRTYHLYKFSHGAIGAAAAGDISHESWRMLKRAASVFSLAYSRFKDLTQARIDLKKLKEEKKRAEEALTELQATQKQLIQSEKMASLGELTAGIAHEIQNPLNFVNNFSDVSNELLEEMKQELATGNTHQAMEIVNGVKENLEKILHHGKRADAIVKGMLQHSRSSSGQKELTDINTLAEEYLRLAYHGLRAKDKFFNAKFETDLDRSISKINVVPQEIGRVILNLINNSFYAVSEKKRGVSNGYEPSVTVSTKKINDKVEIRVKDNGNGISQKDLDKIFQPFFTTKPTGQGTGLGLSLSYDIVTKGHGGEIKVETKEGEGSEFTITLPMN